MFKVVLKADRTAGDTLTGLQSSLSVGDVRHGAVWEIF